MKKKLKYVLTFVWFSYLIVSSILLFSRGFLLTRTVQEKNATCHSRLEPFCTSSDQTNCLIENSENTNKLYSEAQNVCINSKYKVVLLIVDALRYDFTLFNEGNTSPLPYQNKLPVIKNALQKYPNSTRLFKFIADPPTTTMQRLKALTTGSLPTFVDAGSNFATSEINEDNIIDQVSRNNYSVVFMGDDTWASLYPNRFLRHYPYPSFDVWDLDTVDNGVVKSIFPELKQNDWNLLVGHFLGVDHCGHRYGPNHPEMARKLTEINGVLQKVIDELSDDTILFVVGDHGMTATGDHGGESNEEVNAAMFVYSKQPLLSFGANNNAVKQVDLVPTLSALLGVPIPFQNLGILIYNALPSSLDDSWKVPLFWLWNNAQQIVHYINVYSESTSVFNKEYLDLYSEEFESLRREFVSVKSGDDFRHFSEKTINFLEKLRILCEEVWIQFDPFSITNGLTFLFLAIFFMHIISDGIPLQYISHCIENSFISALCLMLLITTIFIGVIEMSNLVENVSYTFVFVANVVSPLMFVIPIFQNWEFISSKWYKRKVDVVSLMCRIVLLFNVVVSFSNSFINEEASVLLFLFATIFLVAVLHLAWYRKGTSKKLSVKSLVYVFLVFVFLRGSAYFWRCRVEQQWCFTSPHEVANAVKSQASKLEWVMAVVSLFLLVNLSKLWLRHCGNLSGYSLTQFLTKIIPMVVVVCMAGFWVLQKYSNNKFANKIRLSYLALSVYGLSSISILVLVFKPICISLIVKDRSYDGNDRNLISTIYNRLKSNLEKDSAEVPVVCGLGTAYSAVYIILVIYLVLIFALVLGDAFAFSTFIMITVGGFFLLVTSMLRIKQAETVEDLLNVPTITVIGWILLAQYFFYATGHQPAFPNISWDAAFIGTSGIFSHRYILGSLIIINTFGSYIIMGIMLPLLIITPFTLFMMMPSIIGKNIDFLTFSQKGEMILYERSKLVYASMFSLCCKYVCGFSIKVFACMLAATIHCRHLMVWNVFAPKFIFEGVAMFVTLASVLLGYLLFIRIHNQIETCINKLNKVN